MINKDIRVAIIIILFLFLISCTGKWVSVVPYTRDESQGSYYNIHISFSALLDAGYSPPDDPYKQAYKLARAEFQKLGLCVNGIIFVERLADVEGGHVGYIVKCNEDFEESKR